MFKMNSRSQYIDISKGIAIIAVVLLHIDYTFYNHVLLPVEVLLGGGWHVAVFFILGGFFLKEEKLIQPIGFIKGKIKSLYKLLLYFYIPAVLLHNVMLQIGWYDTMTDYGGKHMTHWGFTHTVKELVMSVCLAGREPILGAMWFVYVLFIALCGLSFVSWTAKQITRNEKQYEWIRMIVLLGLCMVSCTMSNVMGFNIPRFNNSLTAMWLIYSGYILKSRLIVDFSNIPFCLLCCMIVYHSASMLGEVSLNNNVYNDALTLTVSSVAMLYVICCIAKCIEHNPIGKFLARCGKDSFYIMGLHFVGFKMATYLLMLIGINNSLSALKAPAGASFFQLILYLTMGVLLPLTFMLIFRKTKSLIFK